MQKYTIEAGTELDLIKLRTILSDFQTSTLPELQKMKDYYAGKQKISLKEASDSGKPCNKITVNYCNSIVKTYSGYMCGKPIAYNGENIEDIIEVLSYNDVKDADTELLKSALIYGKAFEICYVDEDGKVRFKTLDSRQCVPVYDDTLEEKLVYIIRCLEYKDASNNEEKYWVEVYDDKSCRKYKATAGFNSFSFIEETNNFFNQVPVTVFDLGSDEESIFKQVISLQDAYNSLLSGEVDDFDAFADAYLVLKGMDVESSDLDNMKRHRVLLMDKDSDATYLTKNISDTQIENMLQNINDQIWNKSACPDFSDEKLLAQSGEALKLKTLNFENAASNIESYMKKALQKRIELICSILHLTNEAVLRDVDIVFTRNLPISLIETAQALNSYRGIVSMETLLAQVPFVYDVQEELERVNAENEAKMKLYQFEDTNYEGGIEE